MSQPVREAETSKRAFDKLRRTASDPEPSRCVMINRAQARALLADRDRLAGEVDRYEKAIKAAMDDLGWGIDDLPGGCAERILVAALSDSKEEE